MAHPEKIDDDMSMDEILASIRRIISEDSKNEDRTFVPREEEHRTIPFPTPQVVKAQEENVAPVVEEVKTPREDAPLFMASTGTTLYGFSKENKGEFFSAPPEFGSIRPTAPAATPTEPAYVAGQTTQEKTVTEKPAVAPTAIPDMPMPTLNLVGDQNSQLQAFIYDLIRPLLKDWVNAYLPSLIEKAVAAEVSKMFQKLREP